MADPTAYDRRVDRYLATSPAPALRRNPSDLEVEQILATTWHCRGCRDAYVMYNHGTTPTRFAILANRVLRRTPCGS